MRYVTTKVLIVLLLLISLIVHSQSDNGTVAFDFPNVPSSEFQFDLDRCVITLVMEDPTSDIARLFNNMDNLYLRSYRRRSVNFKEIVQYYREILKKRGWNALGQGSQDDIENDNLHLYTLQENETVNGLFAILKSNDDVYLINIVGAIPKKQLGDLLLNLNQLGIEISELMSLKPRDLKLVPPAPSPTPEAAKSTPTPPITIDIDEKVDPSLQENQEPAKSWNWRFDGKRIHDIQLQGVDGIESSNIVKVLENGSGDIAEVMPVLERGLLNSSKKASLRVEIVDTRHIAIITVADIPITRTQSVLKSLTISGSGSINVHKSTSDKLVSQKSDAQTSTVGTRFWAGDVPIHEIRIRGNQKVSEARIQQTLENSSPDIEQALKTLFKAMPYFKKVNLQVDEENSKYIATITVDEKPLSTGAYLGLNPLLRFGFTRVTGWEIGTGFEVGKWEDIGPLWTWSVGNSERDQNSRLFGKVSYAFGNPHLHYRVGGEANWGKPYIWNLGLTAQIHRLTDVVAPELFFHDDGTSILQRVIGIPNFQNYYLRQGVEVALQWAPIMPTHSFKLATVTESHANLQKSTDWFAANLRSSLSVRGNPPITPGRMRSFTFQYDFNNRPNSLGWHNTLFIEHSNAAVGSDFDFTRLHLHLRYAFPLQNNRIRTRFLFGFSDAALPIQRQFVIDGIGGLRGYPWYRQESDSEGLITYKSGHTSSPYTFTGDRGFLLNVEYHHSLSNLSSWSIFKNAFAIVFLDEGQVWNVSHPTYTFNPRGNIGIGLQFGEDDSILRVNIAQAFESGKGIQVTTVWHRSF